MAKFQKGNPGGPGRPKGAKIVKTIKNYVRSNEIDVGAVWFESIMQINDAHKRSMALAEYYKHVGGLPPKEVSEEDDDEDDPQDSADVLSIVNDKK